jgi:hypothetical protein
LRRLPALTKALFSAGRFVSVDGGVAQFALPTAPHRDRCMELSPQVEAALAAHFGTAVPLTLVVDEGTSAPPARKSDQTRKGPPPAADPVADGEADVDPDDLRAATATDADQASAAEARLLDAFPGTSEVTG